MSTNYMLVCHQCRVMTDIVIRSSVNVRWTHDEKTVDAVEAFLKEHVVDHPDKLAIVDEHHDAFVDYEDRSPE